VVAYGDGGTEHAALHHLREGLLGLVDEFGAPLEQQA
jgi:hypothetical protein